MSVTDRIIGVESGGNPNARNPRSSAAGLGQFIDSTWLSMIRKNKPELAGRSDAELIALKSDPNLSREMTSAYANENSGLLRASGFEPTPGNVYLSHFAGPAGAKSLLSASPDAPVEAVLGQQAVAANPFLAGKTARDVVAWAEQKMGGAGPSSAPPPAPTAPTAGPTPAPTGLLASAAPQEQQADPMASFAGLLAPSQQQESSSPELPRGLLARKAAPRFALAKINTFRS